MESPLIFIVEDDVKLGDLLVEYLEAEGLRTRLARRGDGAVELIRAAQPDLVVLDWMLPGESGLSVCQRLRPDFEGSIVMLTARRTDMDQIIGLEVGADDYVTKPVEPRLLLARIRSRLRAAERGRAPQGSAGPLARVEVGALRLEPADRSLHVGAHPEPVPLTSTEYELLSLLLHRAGDVVTRDEISILLKGVPHDGVDRGMDIHVSRIRRKLAAYGVDANFIRSVRSVGYFIGLPT